MPRWRAPTSPAACHAASRGCGLGSAAGLRELAELITATVRGDHLAVAGVSVSAMSDGADRPVGLARADMADTLALGAAKSRRARERERPPHEGSIDEAHVETWHLVSRAQEGDGEAFGQLYDRYVDAVFRYIYFRVNDRGLAEDFTSETFLRALRRISGITYQGRDIGAWFVTIARNIVLDHLKSARHRLEVTTGDVIEGNELAPSPEASVLSALTSDHLIAAVKRLNDEQRECIVLRFVHGLSVSETAEAMGKNDGAIKALQHRAVRKLADLVGGDLR